MKKFLVILGVLVVASAAFAMSDLYVSGSWRYKMTVIVETPEGIKSGSAVRELSGSASNIKVLDFPESTSTTNVRGEAVVVDLGERGVLFALISSDSYRDVSETFPYISAKGIPDRIRHFKNLEPGSKSTLAKEHWPKMVTFTDMDDSKSVELVYAAQRTAPSIHAPFKITDRVEELFGEDVKIKEIIIEITDEPVTWGVVDEWLPWLRALIMKDARLNGSTSTAISTNNLADNLGAGSFSKGEKK